MIPCFARRACRFTRLLSTATGNAAWSEEAIQPFSKFVGKSIRKGESIDLSQQQLEDLISTEDEKLAQAYILHANSVTEVHFSNEISLHGFMDLHNMCERNCQHCWMRRANKDVKRFMCFPTHVYDNMEWLYNNGIGTIVICSGEFNNEGRTEFIENIIHNTIDKSKEIDKGLREKKGDFSGGAAIQIGLQMGEIPLNTGKRYFKNGANLFYLRMEAMDRLLYKDVFIRERGYDERCE
ncbi:Iron hydrogenase assembly protein [Blastocystis hominis]|uniref:Iron hydrogenase assembly protein n=1 Tax=Blastocystis hominis TaxID=12968 RepID=D8MAA9_BLAHO|nr:Iron hydrogenase assembly protein [Blastocystis hominis]CBK24998.2 Iron hydrogenase assembly protein [Blastocystis hominis]|eukprot:XP_012899046.1 Iron hydrogenase assembly protein [Blastocystis hominis]